MPEYTLTEDYALGMELKMRQWQVRRSCSLDNELNKLVAIVTVIGDRCCCPHSIS